MTDFAVEPMMMIGAKQFVSYLLNVDGVQPHCQWSDNHAACLNLHEAAVTDQISCEANHALHHSVNRLIMKQFTMSVCT